MERGCRVAECSECGADNPEGAEFCGLCANRFPKEKPAAPAREKWSSLEGLRSATEKSKGHAWIWLTAILVVIAVAVLTVVLVKSHMEQSVEGSSEYVGTSSGLTFKYPATWEKKDFKYLKTLAHGQEIDPMQGNEIVLLAHGNTIYRHLLIVSSRASDYGAASWEEIESALQSAIAQEAGTEGMKVTFIKPGLRASSGAHVVAVMYTVTGKGGPPLLQIEASIIKGNLTYTFAMTTPLAGGGSDEGDARSVFTRLMNSVTFSK
jgi:hypothetical protein